MGGVLEVGTVGGTCGSFDRVGVGVASIVR